jgi:hypothetical protein
VAPETCGEGLVESAPLPGAMAEVTAAVAENLERHLAALAPGDAEHAVYVELATSLRRDAAELTSAAERMAAQGDLPMGRHDEAAMATPEVAGAFERLVRAEASLSGLLAARAPEHEELLAMMRRTAAG